jgi:long-chain acyl-CoA synthetase
MYRNPDKIALREGERSCDYQTLVDRIDRVTAAIAGDLRLGPSTHGAILAGNCIEYVEVIAGSAQAGVPMATVNPRLSVTEVTQICDDAEAVILFVDQAHAEMVRDMDFASITRIIEFGKEYDDWVANAHSAHSLAPIPEWDVFTIPYTSGTTGRPKGVLVSHRSRLLTIFGMAVEYGCYSPDDRFLAIAPMCHGAGLVFSLAPLYFGGYAQIVQVFDPEEVLRALKQDQMTGVFMVPTHFHGIFALDDKVRAANRPERLNAIISNAAPLPQSTKELIVDYFGEGLLHETYGSTEAGIVTNLRPVDQLLKEKCVGQPFPETLIRLLDEDGQECAPNEVGELFSLSPYLFNGYWNRPEETEAAFRDGWCTVGDLAKRDEEGYIYLVDRKKDMVITGGVNVYPREIEEVLIRHPAVSDVAVIGVPDERWGERLRAFVVLQRGQGLDTDTMIEFCEGQLARFKVPRDLKCIDALPRNAGGKVLKTELREFDS